MAHIAIKDRRPSSSACVVTPSSLADGKLDGLPALMDGRREDRHLPVGPILGELTAYIELATTPGITADPIKVVGFWGARPAKNPSRRREEVGSQLASQITIKIDVHETAGGVARTTPKLSPSANSVRIVVC